MKKITLLINSFTLLFSAAIFSQANNYLFASSTGTLDAMSSSQQLLGSGNDDNSSAVTNLGFTFKFAGVDYTQFSVNTNGILRFGNVSIAEGGTSYTPSRTNAGLNSPCIMPFWKDLHTSSNGKVHFVRTGTAPNRVLKIEWFVNLTRNATSGANIKFQLWLYETSNTIECIYGNDTGSSGFAVGLATSQNLYSAYKFNTNTLSNTSLLNAEFYTIPAGTKVSFSVPAPCSGTITGGTISPTTSNLCTGNTQTFVCNDFSAFSQMQYQWQTSPDGVANWTDVSAGVGFNTVEYTTSAYSGGTQFYRLAVTCPSNTTTAYSDIATVSVASAPSTQASNLNVSDITSGSAFLTWSMDFDNGSVVYLSDSPIFTPPVDGVPLGATSTLYSGSGQQLIYNNSSNFVSINNLSPATTYYVRVYRRLTCSAGVYFYNTSISSANEISFTTRISAFTPISTGTWNNPAVWNHNRVPNCSDEVVIPAGFGVTVNSSGNVCSRLTVRGNGLLILSNGELTIGCTNNNAPFELFGTMTVGTGAILNVNGYIIAYSGSTFNQHGGEITIDGNSGIESTSVTDNSLLEFSSNKINFTAGRITIVDPHIIETKFVVRNLFSINTKVNFSKNHVFRFGDGISTQAGSNSDYGFRTLMRFTGDINFGTLEINGRQGANRFFNSNSFRLGINGDLIINQDSEFKNKGYAIFLSGNLVNNGTYTGEKITYFGDNSSNTFGGMATNRSTVSGSGVFRNSDITPTAQFGDVIIHNQQGVIFPTKNTTIAGGIEFKSGISQTIATDENISLTGTATLSGTLNITAGLNFNITPGTQTFTIINANNISGTFATVNFPAGTGYQWSIVYTTNSVIITFVADYKIYFVKPTASGSATGLSWTDASSNLQTIINNATTGDEVWVMEGAYKPTATNNRATSFSLKNGVKVYGAFLGSENYFVQRNPNANQTILSGDIGTAATTDNSYHVISNLNIDATAVLDGFTITDGFGQAEPPPNSFGAGIYNVFSSPTLKNIIIANNSAVTGGGMYNNNSSPTLENIVFSNNTANIAGGIYNINNSSPTITNCVFSENIGNFGVGCMINNANSNPTITSSTFYRNRTNSGTLASGISNNNSSPTIKNCIIWANINGSSIVNSGTAAPAVFYSNIQQASGNYAGVGNINLDPNFVGLSAVGSDNIWLTADDGLRLQMTSPCIDTATNTGAPTVDILDRPQFNANKDMGAYEWQGNTFCDFTTIWNGTSWSNGTPNAQKSTLFEVNYTATANITACSVAVSGTANVVFPNNFNLTVTNEVIVGASTTLTFENNSNLIQINAATNTGNIVYKRNTSINRLDYTYWSSPVAGQNLLNFTPNTLPNRFYTYSEPTKLFVQVTSPSTTNFADAKGYSLRAPNNFFDAPAAAQTFTGVYKGVPNNGNFTIPVTFTAGQGIGYNLIGNPYPSTVSGTAFLTANTGSIYFWTHQLLNAGVTNYATMSLGGETAATAGGVGALPNRFIQVGQGFMFLTTTSKSVTFTNAMRQANNANQFFRSAATAQNDKIWLNLTNNNGLFSQTLVGYLPNTTTAFDDGFDAPQLNTNGLSSMISNNKYAIQSRGNFDNTDVVKLNLNIDTAGNYTISKDNTEGIFSSTQDFFLKDNLVGVTHNIKQSPYNFVAIAGETANRFELVYQSVLSNNDNQFNAENVIVFENNKLLNISATQDLKAIKIFDLQGRNIFEAKDINSKSIVLTGFRPQQQVLMVQITSLDNRVVTKKVVF
jgi:hypothetical protein